MSATFTKLPDGETWGIRVPCFPKAGSGDKVSVTKRNGKTTTRRLGTFVKTDGVSDTYTIQGKESNDMARTASMTAEQAESLLGARGQLVLDSTLRQTMKKWLTANGIPSSFAGNLPLNSMEEAFNDVSNMKLDVMRQAARNMGESSDAGDDSDDESEESIPATLPSNGHAKPTHATNGKGSDIAAAAQLLADALAGQRVQGVDADAVRAIIRAELPSLIPTTRIEVHANGKVTTVEGNHHPQFATLCKLATARGTDGYVPNIFLSGEASSGKTTGCKMLAKALNFPWHFNGAISQPHEMLGWKDAGGTYHRTPFREAYEFGGVYTFDEVDRSDPAALLGVNPHLANGLATFPDGQIKRHPDCIITGTGNTWGLGADANYSGATKLDGAFMSRFPNKLAWDIDEKMERAISGDDIWAKRVQEARRKARAAGLKVMIDVRITLAGAALIRNGLSMDETASVTYLANLKADQRKLIGE